MNYINKKKKVIKNLNSSKFSTSPKSIPIPRTYATVTTPIHETSLPEYPPLPIHHIEQPMPKYELFPLKPAIQKQEPLREIYYNNLQSSKIQHTYYNIPPTPPHIQQMIYSQRDQSFQYYNSSSMNMQQQIPLQHYNIYRLPERSICMLYHHENLWNPLCKNELIRQHVRESFKYFPY